MNPTVPVLSVPAVADIVAGAFGAFTSAAIASIGVTDCSAENEEVITQFLTNHPDWQIVPPSADNPAAHFVYDCGWIKVLPHEHDMDGFFMVKLQKK